MTAGRPLKFQSVEELQDAPNGNVIYIGEGIGSADFTSEREMQSFITGNISKFCLDVLNDKFISLKQEYDFTNSKAFGPRKKRIDLFVECQKANYLIELKNPKYMRENLSALGQLLNYGRKIIDSTKKTEMVLVSSKMDRDTVLTIIQYDLPVIFVYFDRSRSMRFLNVCA